MVDAIQAAKFGVSARRALVALEDVFHVVGCLCLCAIALLIAGDALSRVVFGAPIQMQFELVEFYLMPATATLSISRVYRENGHIRIEILPYDHLPAPLVAATCFAVQLVSLVFFALLVRKAGGYALRALLNGEIYMGVYDWPLGIAYMTVPLGCGVLCLRLAADLLMPTHSAGGLRA